MYQPGRAAVVAPRRARRTIHEERGVKAATPPGLRFKGYENFVMREPVLRAPVLRPRRECWVTPDGQRITAALPTGISGHLGPELWRFVLARHHQGQIMVARLLIAGQDGFVDEARDVPRAGRSARVGFRWTTPARGIGPRMASARRSATRTSPGSAPPRARAG